MKSTVREKIYSIKPNCLISGKIEKAGKEFATLETREEIDKEIEKIQKEFDDIQNEKDNFSKEVQLRVLCLLPRWTQIDELTQLLESGDSKAEKKIKNINKKVRGYAVAMLCNLLWLQLRVQEVKLEELRISEMLCILA